ncbi:serine/threonine protein kinase [Bacillaceae bacterium SIJ1]|uniref:serine/threonine protein kinase n=1 Tax=Litoribacterium kuwaitense TaxID=1398745 RepID=UPI0013EC9D44|nr:serine/threonine protein kinase [Litoribacterium kuwaitense]NGP45923.1 serine/threonine protein kinase [Litoribacterium kuwaitense]
MTTIHHHTVGTLTFPLQKPHDFAWLYTLGNPFCVFDQQDSGNVCFGIIDQGVKKFVKYAGAAPVRYAGSPERAVDRLKSAATLYESLGHPALVTLLDHFPIGQGYALLFSWQEGESLHDPVRFPPPAKNTDPSSPFYRFRALSLQDKLNALETIFAFHQWAEERGYVAVDFYDGSLLYDFQAKRLTICDIDLYETGPLINTMGRMWGSSRFMAPEEFAKDAVLDRRTNVYRMGATAFVLLGGAKDRSLAAWSASRALHEVALQAVEPNRDERFPDVRSFFEAWKKKNG